MGSEEGSDDELDLAQAPGRNSRQRPSMQLRPQAADPPESDHDRAVKRVLEPDFTARRTDIESLVVVCSKVPWLRMREHGPLKKTLAELAKQPVGQTEPISGRNSLQGSVAANKPKRGREEPVQAVQHQLGLSSDDDAARPQKKGRRDKDAIAHPRSKTGEQGPRGAPQGTAMRGAEQLTSGTSGTPGARPGAARRADMPASNGKSASDRAPPTDADEIVPAVLHFCKTKWPTRFTQAPQGGPREQLRSFLAPYLTERRSMPAAAAAGVPKHPAAPGANAVKRPDGHKGLMRRNEQDQDTQRRRSEDQGRPSDQSRWTQGQWREHYEGVLRKKLKEKDAAHKAALETAVAEAEKRVLAEAEHAAAEAAKQAKAQQLLEDPMQFEAGGEEPQTCLKAMQSEKLGDERNFCIELIASWLAPKWLVASKAGAIEECLFRYWADWSKDKDEDGEIYKVVGPKYRGRVRELSMKMCPIGLSPLTHRSPMGSLSTDPTDEQVDELIRSVETELLDAAIVRGKLWSGELDFSTFVCDILIECGLVANEMPPEFYDVPEEEQPTEAEVRTAAAAHAAVPQPIPQLQAGHGTQPPADSAEPPPQPHPLATPPAPGEGAPPAPPPDVHVHVPASSAPPQPQPQPKPHPLATPPAPAERGPGPPAPPAAPAPHAQAAAAGAERGPQAPAPHARTFPGQPSSSTKAPAGHPGSDAPGLTAAPPPHPRPHPLATPPAAAEGGAPSRGGAASAAAAATAAPSGARASDAQPRARDHAHGAPTLPAGGDRDQRAPKWDNPGPASDAQRRPRHQSGGGPAGSAERAPPAPAHQHHAHAHARAPPGGADRGPPAPHAHSHSYGHAHARAPSGGADRGPPQGPHVHSRERDRAHDRSHDRAHDRGHDRAYDRAHSGAPRPRASASDAPEIAAHRRSQPPPLAALPDGAPPAPRPPPPGGHSSRPSSGSGGAPRSSNAPSPADPSASRAGRR